MLVSVVIRTLNEAKYLHELLSQIERQERENFSIELVLVDSGSTDDTLIIAESHGCRITHIRKDDFTFGRSLNVGCQFANGDVLVFISGHCIPANTSWLKELVRPIRDEGITYCYGKQLGRDTTKFSERRLFEKYFPDFSKIPQKGFFCNNANSALLRSAWERWKFDEQLTGLEDMHLAKKITEHTDLVGYAHLAEVYHIHDEYWSQTKRRYEREAIALQKIYPEIHVHFGDFLRYYFSAIFQDMGAALLEKVLFKEFFSILSFRLAQYWGTYKGNHEHRKLSAKMKEQYFYPRNMEHKN